jgi:RNA polymerase sigma factor (sigma-70 family)
MPTATTATRARVSLAPLPGLADADLVRRARDGDDRAFEEIVRRYRAPLIRYSSRHVGRDHAEDVTQHAFARAHLHLRGDPRPIHLRAWLYRVAHNAAINMRSRKDWGHDELSPDVDGVPQPPDVAAQRSEVREIVANMDDLPDRQAAALRMSVFEGLDYEEIARHLGTSPNSVRALLSRARSQLRKAAAAISPLPLLAWLSRRAYGLAGAAGGEGGVVAAGGVAQAKLIAIAATTVVAGAATVDRAGSAEPPVDHPAGLAAVSAPDPDSARSLAINVDSLISNSAAAAAPNPPVAEAPPATPAEEVPIEEAPVEPAVEPAVEPPIEPPVAEEPPPIEPLPPVDPDPAPVDDSAPKDPPADDGGGSTEPPPDEYVPPPPDEYVPPPSDEDVPPPSDEDVAPPSDDSVPPPSDDSTGGTSDSYVSTEGDSYTTG